VEDTLYEYGVDLVLNGLVSYLAIVGLKKGKDTYNHFVVVACCNESFELHIL
jgi:hypothetical protein